MRNIFIITALILTAFPASTQELPLADATTQNEAIETTTEGSSTLFSTKGFNELLLGITYTQAKEALLEDSDFIYTGGDDFIDPLNPPTENFIDVDGSGYIKTATLQFHENALIVLTLRLDSEFLDNYTILNTLTEKYGTPTSIDPTGAYWEDEEYRFAIEYPLTIKYTDKKTLDSIAETTMIDQNLKYRDKIRFINKF